jgi:hypothetical protein
MTADSDNLHVLLSEYKVSALCIIGKSETLGNLVIVPVGMLEIEHQKIIQPMPQM